MFQFLQNESMPVAIADLAVGFNQHVQNYVHGSKIFIS